MTDAITGRLWITVSPPANGCSSRRRPRMSNQNSRPSAGCAAGPSPRAQTVSLKMLDVSLIAAPLLAPAQHHGVEALRDLDQASPGLRMRHFERQAQHFGGKNAAPLHHPNA